MKKQLLTLSMVALATITFGQTALVKNEAEKTQSKAQVFSERSGTLVEKRFLDIGKLKGASIQVAIYTDLITNQKTSAVQFEKEYRASYSSSSDTKVALLDSDEIDALVKSLTILQEKVFKTSPTDYTEINFRSRSGFAAGCFYSKGKWSAYMKLEKYDSNSYVFFEMEETQTFIDLLGQAKLKLNS